MARIAHERAVFCSGINHTPLDRYWYNDTHPDPVRDLKMTTYKGRHVYVRNDIDYTSVTHMLDLTKSDADRESLAAWRQRVGTGVANHVRDAAVKIGSEAHKLVEAGLWAHNDASDLPNGGFQGLIRAVPEHGGPTSLYAAIHARQLFFWASRMLAALHATEYMVCDDGLKLAGTIDAIGQVYEDGKMISGPVAVVDWKCVNRPTSVRDDYRLQAMLYGYMWNVCVANRHPDLKATEYRVVASVASPPQVVVLSGPVPSDIDKEELELSKRLEAFRQAGRPARPPPTHVRPGLSMRLA